MSSDEIDSFFEKRKAKSETNLLKSYHQLPFTCQNPSTHVSLHSFHSYPFIIISSFRNRRVSGDDVYTRWYKYEYTKFHDISNFYKYIILKYKFKNKFKKKMALMKINEMLLKMRLTANSNFLKFFYKVRHKDLDYLASLLESEIFMNNPIFIRVLETALYHCVKRNKLILAYMLLCKGVNADNDEVYGMPAIHLAALNESVDMVRLILMTSSPNIDSYKDYDNRTTREVIENLPGLSLDPNFFEDLEIPPMKEQALKFFLNNSDETKCLKVMKEGFHSELTYDVTEELLDVATRRKYYKIIQEILNRFIKNQGCSNMLKASAVTKGNHIVLRELFKLQPRVTDELLLQACKLLEINQSLNNIDTFDWLECLKLILEQKNVNVRCADDLGNTPMQIVLKAKCYEAATLLLKQGSYLGSMNESNIADIPAFILFNHLNDCIQLKNEWTDECTIEFDYRCLMPHDKSTEQLETYRTTREMVVILYIANNDNLKHFLKHPLISSFLYIKWYKIWYISLAIVIFYGMLCSFLITYMSLTYDTSPSKSGKQNICYPDIFLWVFAMGMLLLFIFREIPQFFFYPRCLTDSKNWFQILLIVLTLWLLCGAGFQIGVIVILLSTWELTTLINNHLFPSNCIEMFRTVSLNFIRFFFPYLLFILAFAMAFCMLFKKDNFSNLGLSLFKTIIMFTGEFDANDIPFSTYPVWSRIVFVLFVFHIVLVLLNLLNGLAINNIAEILHKVEIIGLISRIRSIAYFEKITVGKRFWKSHWCNPFNFISNKISVFPHYLQNGKMTFKPYDNLIFHDKDKYWSTLKMDPNVIKHAKQIVYIKNEPSNDDIMNEFAKVLTRLIQLKATLSSYAK